MRVVDLGVMAHHEAEALQLATLAEVLAGGEQTLFLVEHPKVITLGRQGGQENLHVNAAFLANQGIELAQTRRGGNITCHFPGQLVAYPILHLRDSRLGARAFVEGLEDVLVKTLGAVVVQGLRLVGA